MYELTAETVRVLLIDSDDSTSRTFTRILQKNNMTVSLARNSQDARKEIEATHFDAVVISLEVPDVDGKDLLVFAKSAVPNVARLVAIDVPSLETGIKALESGADAVFSKPVVPEALVSVIKKIVSTSQT